MLTFLLDAFVFHLFGPPTFTQKDLDALIEDVAALDRDEGVLNARLPESGSVLAAFEVTERPLVA